MKIAFLKNIGFGLFIGMCIATIFYLVVDNSYAGDVKGSLTHGLTILSSLLAAGLALAGVITNIQTQVDQEEKRRLNSLQAAKATLPLALSELTSISRRGIEIRLDINCTGRSATELLEEVRLSDLVLQSIKETIEYSDKISGQRLASIVATYQILNSRLSSFLTESNPTDFERASSAVNWATLYRKIGDAFDFARNEADAIPSKLSEPSTYGVFHVLMLINIWDYPKLQNEITRAAALDDPERI